MPEYVDLHLHSTFSDGLLTPTELVTMASEAGLKAIALADHDNVDGISEAMTAGATVGIEVMTGVELSVLWEHLDELHLLGYDFDHRNEALCAALAEFRAFRMGRSQRVLGNINRRLVEENRTSLDFASIQKRAGGTLGRPHIGQALVEAGYVKTMDEAFDRYLVPCNEPKRFFPLDEAIALIHAAGGCAVLAHPPFIRVTNAEMKELLDTFAGLGLDGVEAYNSGTDNNGIDQMITLTRRKGLIVTGGSDFHQPIEGGIEVGQGRGNLKIPYRCVEEIREASKRYQQG